MRGNFLEHAAAATRGEVSVVGCSWQGADTSRDRHVVSRGVTQTLDTSLSLRQVIRWTARHFTHHYNQTLALSLFTLFKICHSMLSTEWQDRTVCLSLVKSVYLFSRIIVSHFPGFHQPESVCQHRVNIAINELHLWSLITSLTPLRAIIHGDRKCPDCAGLVCVTDGPAAGDCVFNWHLTAGMLRRWRPGITKQWICSVCWETNHAHDWRCETSPTYDLLVTNYILFLWKQLYPYPYQYLSATFADPS